MIYLAFYLIRAALLLAFPIAWLAGLYFLVKTVRRYFSSGAIPYATAAVVALVPLAWIGYGWISFKETCSELKPLVTFIDIERQQSVLLRLDLGVDFGKAANMQIGPILDSVGLVCIETEFWKPITSPQTGETFRFDRRCGREYSRNNSLISNYAVTANATRDATGLGYVLIYRVEDIKRTRMIAEAREAIFGRGLLNQYIGLFSGSNNPEYLACGYVDYSPRIWRNSRVGMGHPDYEAYKAIDQKLFEIASGQANAR